jgi:hypothetical protein
LGARLKWRQVEKEIRDWLQWSLRRRIPPPRTPKIRLSGQRQTREGERPREP